MKFTDIGKTLKENIAAIITAMIVFACISYYIFVLVPANEHAIDTYNIGLRDEFSAQFNNTLNDYATQINLERLKKNIRAKVVALEQASIDAPGNKIKRDTAFTIDSVLADIKNNIIIQSIHIEAIRNDQDSLKLFKVIDLDFSKYASARYSFPAAFLTGVSRIRDTTTVDKPTIKNRLAGAAPFTNWIICSEPDKKVIFENEINPIELDSLSKNLLRQSGITFKTSNYRFYKKAFTLENTNYKVMIAGAVRQDEFEAQTKKIDLDLLIFAIILTLLLFLSIPLMKPLISSTKEKLSQGDVLSTTSGVGVLIVTMVCFCMCMYLFKENKIRNKEIITGIGKDVRNSIASELSVYKVGLTRVSISLHEPEQANIHTPIDRFRAVMPVKDSSSFARLQNYFNFDKNGDIVRDICTDENFMVRRNYKERDYFRMLHTSDYRNTLTAVYSKYDNVYKFVYVQKDKNGSLSGFAYIPQPVSTRRTEECYGYILCRATGKVLLHSNPTKSLKENLFRNSQDPFELLKTFHGINDDYFEMTYNGKPCFFYCQRLDDISDYPLYLLTYIDLESTNNLKMYTVLHCFILSIAYGFGIILLGLFYSIFYYRGEISLLSRFHFHWMFPDNSRKQEYILLRRINYSFLALFILLLFVFNDHIIYYMLLAGVNLGFLNFVLLNQRSFRLHEQGFLKNKKMLYLSAYIITAGFILPFICSLLDFYSYGFSLSVLSHLVYLQYLRKKKTITVNGATIQVHEKEFPPVTGNKSLNSKRSQYISFFSSIICYHYLLIPLVLAFGLFSNEVQKQRDYYYASAPDKTAQKNTGGDNLYHPGVNDMLYTAVQIIQPPSAQLLYKLNFNTCRTSDMKKVKPGDFLLNTQSYRPTMYLVLVLMALVLIVNRLVNFYAGRFFFFELSESYRIGCYTKSNAFTNYEIIIPPYNESDLKNMELYERFNPDIAKSSSACDLGDIPPSVVSNEVKMDLIMNNNLETYKNQYLAEWEKLDKDEKFVMSDFAVDYFVNYKNRNIVVRLMQKGYIIGDPLTGRLRVMNFGFRNFIMNIDKQDPDSAAVIREAENTKGAFSKWRLPVIIVAISILLLMMFIFKTSYDKVILFGGSILSAMGLLTKFMDTYKK